MVCTFREGHQQHCLPPHSQTSQQLVAQRLSLSDGAQPTSGNFLSIKLEKTEQDVAASSGLHRNDFNDGPSVHPSQTNASCLPV